MDIPPRRTGGQTAYGSIFDNDRDECPLPDLQLQFDRPMRRPGARKIPAKWAGRLESRSRGSTIRDRRSASPQLSMTLNETQTRALHIDPQLRAADWKLNDRTQVRLEVPVDGYDAEPWNGVTDYCMYDASGNVLAVVEAKRCSRNAREADEQLRHNVTEIAKKQPFAPFGFMATAMISGSGRSALLIRASSPGSSR